MSCQKIKAPKISMNTYNIKRIMRTSPLGKSGVYLALRYLVKKKEIDSVIRKYLGEDVEPQYKQHIKKQMREAMINYRWDFDEYFIFHYDEYDDAKRRSFVPEFDKNVFCDIVNDKTQADVFLDKWTTYEHFKDFFGRDVFNIRHLNDLQSHEFEQFIAKHPSFIMKPVYGTRGAGIQVINTGSIHEAREVLSYLYAKGIKAMILEELIVQDDKLAALHRESAKTLRVTTIRYDDHVDVIFAYLRMGKGASVIDNASAGGVFGVINIETGKIYAACDRLGGTFEKHPDSGINLIGFEIPRWNEVKEFVKRAAQVLPKVRYVGWDVAVTQTGCVLIEGNDKGRWSFQIPKQEGFRDEMNAILKRLGKKPLN